MQVFANSISYKEYKLRQQKFVFVVLLNEVFLVTTLTKIKT